MLMPGFSSPRVPVQVRLFVAITTTLALTPLLLPALEAVLPEPQAGALLPLVIGETIIGVSIGLLGRIVFLALHFMAAALASFVGHSGLPEIPIGDNEPGGALASLITLTATVMFFGSDLHLEALRGLAQSYAVLPVNGPFADDFGLARLVDAAADAFILVLQISSPFVVYAITINMLFGIVNKFTPQIPVYFVSLPFVICGGMALLYLTVGELLTLFNGALATRLARG